MVRLVIYSVAGRRIRVLHDHVLPAGTHTLHWDGTDQDGRSVASGVYFYRLESPAQTRTRKLVLLR